MTSHRRPRSVPGRNSPTRLRTYSGDEAVIFGLEETEGKRFREFYEIYAGSLPHREQKRLVEIRRLVRRSDYRILILERDAHVAAFSIVFLASRLPMALLEYMATESGRRNQGLGALLFEESLKCADERSLLVEVDSEREISGDREIRVRRKEFYRRLGCLQIAGLEYQLPLPGKGAPPLMDLLVRPRPGLSLSKDELRDWLRTIFVDVYSQSGDDPRIEEMLGKVADPVVLI